MEAHISLPYKLTLRDYQVPFWKAAVEADVLRLIVVWPRRNGKDLITLNVLIYKALTRPGLYFYMAPYYTQVRSAIWNGTDGTGRRFLDYIPPELIKKRNEQDLRLELVNGSIIRFCGSDNIDSIVGNNPVGIVFTEFPLHKPEAWHYLRPILAENGGWAIFNGTPRGLNHFYDLFKRAKESENWFVQLIDRDITGIPSKEAIDEDRKSGMPESLIQQEYFCSWTSSSEQTLIPLDIIQPALGNTVTEAEIKDQPRIIGVDPAFAAKGDHAVIARRQGKLLHPLEKFQGLDNMHLAAKVARHIEEWKADVCFIDTGRGEGVISRLDQLGYGDIVVPVDFGGKPESDLYLNKRAEIWCRMRDWFISPSGSPSIPRDDGLIGSLASPYFDPDNARGKIQLESKLHMKNRGLKSTDEGDAVAVTFAEQFSQDFYFRRDLSRDQYNAIENGSKTEYDPYGHFEGKYVN